MKKLLLFLSLCLVATYGSAQVIWYVEAPSPNEGNYTFSWAEPTSGWGTLDLTVPANSVTGTMVMVDDGTGAFPEACDPILNGPALAGNVAVLYRGSCEFGSKALACQNEGAIAVVIINNVPGAPIAMGGGADGGSVTIPVTMISDTDGALLAPEINAGTSTVFIGSKLGFYGDDLGFYPQHILMPQQFSNVALLTQDAADFTTNMGAWVYNYGSNDIPDVTLNCQIDMSGIIYDETSAPVLIPAGDSLFIPLADFSQPSYANGYYTGTYTIAGGTEEFPADNTLPVDFTVSDSIFGYGPTGTDHAPIGDSYYRGASSVLSNSMCMAFRHDNASNVAIWGITYSAASSQNPDPTTMDGQLVEVYAYEWNDVFTDVTDAVVSDINEIGFGEYIYLADLQQENVFVPFETPVGLNDNQWYLFCAQHYGDNDLFLGYNTSIDYALTQNNNLLPIFPGESEGTFYVNGFGTEIVPAMTLKVFDANELSIVEVPEAAELDAYPNPATTTLNIPLTENKGEINMFIYDVTGKMISTQNVTMETNMIEVDVTSIPAGKYIIDLEYENGEKQTVNVLVAH